MGENEVELSDAIEALRGSLERARTQGSGRSVRFDVESVELNLSVTVTQQGKGSAGIRWHVLTAGGERSRGTETAQSLTLRLAPVVVDAVGVPLSPNDQRISDSAGAAAPRDETLSDRG
ncbi:trypco2 family protein [Streptomyces sp. NPDC058457]|uniref:trypco2 family protein n=1 Tax=Streptomyces sp. NPDC058457 TaxID=3346507 RepID=UPI00364B7EB1